MKMEHINENTIKVMIGHSDLEDRGITFFDLLGSQQQVETFFYSILEEMGVRDQFEGVEAVTFQVVPKSDGLDLYISKGLNDNLKDQLKHSYQSNNSKTDTPLDQVMKLLEKEEKKQSKSKQQTNKTTNKDQMYYFERFVDFVSFTQIIKQIKVSTNELYHFDKGYYWIHDTKQSRLKSTVHYYAIEHGHTTVLSPIVIKEHGQLVLADNAVATAQQHFNA